MKHLIIALLALTSLIACNNAKKPNDKSGEQKTTQQEQTTSNDSKPKSTTPENTTKGNEPSQVLLGTWIGEMSAKKLTIVVEEINDTELLGYNILGSNKRDLKGTFTDGAWDQPCTKAYKAILNEPGDDQHDGAFTVKFVGYEDQEETEMGPECRGNLKGVEAHGEWTPNNSRVKKEFHLVKQK